MKTKVVCYDKISKACIHSFEADKAPKYNKGQDFVIPHFEEGKRDYKVASTRMNDSNGEFQIFLEKLTQQTEQKPMGDAPEIKKEDINVEKKANKKENTGDKIKETVNSLSEKCESLLGISLISMVITFILEIIISVVLFLYSPILSAVFGLIVTLCFVGYVIYHNIKKSEIFTKFKILKDLCSST